MSEQRNTAIVSDEPVRRFYIASEYKRAIYWAVGGGVTIAVAACFANEFGLQRDVKELLPVLIGVSGPFVATSYFLMHQLEVDQRGIRKRVLWWWDLWSWDEFASGEIRLGPLEQQYESMTRPVWRQNLSIGYLEKSEAQELDNLIQTLWIPPRPAPVPEALTINILWPDRKTIHFSHDELVVTSKGTEKRYRWENVLEIQIWRMHSRSHDFQQLSIELPDQKLNLLKGHDRSGQIPGFIYAILKIDPGRIQDYSLRGIPRTLQELEARITREELRGKETKQMAYWIPRCMYGMLLLLPVLLPWPQWIIQLGLYAPMAWAVHWLARNTAQESEKRIQELENRRSGFITETPPTQAN